MTCPATFDDFVREVTSATCYDFTDAELRRFFDAKESVRDVIDWADAEIDAALFGGDFPEDVY